MRYAATAAAAALAFVFVFVGGSAKAQSMHQSLKDARQESLSGGNVDKQMPPADYTKKSAVSDMFEVQSAKLALDKAQSQEVKTFAQQMVNDHSKALNDLKAAAQAANMSSSVPDKLDTRHQRLMDKLAQVSGDKFDDMYVKTQLKGHRECVDLQKAYMKTGKPEPLKNFAQKVEPIVAGHLTQVQGLASAER